MKKFRPTNTDSLYHGGDNLLERDFSATTRNAKWVSDITYIHTLADGWCYLASIMDLATAKILGWSFSKTMDTSLALTALDHALTIQEPGKGLILHSERGSQYTSHVYRSKLATNGIRQSFSSKGCPYDNAPIESFHAILKKEMVYRTLFKTYENAKLELFQFIEGRYNRNRIHSAVGYRTP